MSQTGTRQPIAEFISRWTESGAAERANYQLFLCELCDVLGVPRPEPSRADSARDAYVFEHPVVFDDGLGRTSTGFIDLYRRGAFILEAKQGSDRITTEDATGLKTTRRARRGTAVRGTSGWDDAMLAALGQAKLYAQALPAAEGWPPFLVVVDVGHSIELFADFTRSGKTYLAFPTPAPIASSSRISPTRRSASGSGWSGPTRWNSTPAARAPRSPARSPRGWPTWRGRSSARGTRRSGSRSS
jgi:hypothetical protein